MAEPQPAFTNDFCRALFKLQNAVFVSNPATVNIGSAGGFSGFNVLLYHGYSFDYYINEVGSIRNNGGYDRADLMMKFLLKRRHLAPTHSSTLYSPYTSKDPMLIDIVPDFFISGHIHKSAALNYKNITLICGSCWQSKTDFQEKMGHKPEPGKVPIANLATREIKILRFSK
jgi:DNA polymerase II small subunit